MRRLPFVFIALCVVGSACASGSGSGGGGGARGSGDITREDLATLSSFSAFQIVRRLRPQWLRSRGTANLEGASILPVVFVDRSRRGEIRELELIAADDVERIRYLSSRDATTRYGTGFLGGIIEVISRGN